MKKGRRITSLITSLLSLATLASCKDEYKYPDAKWKDGVIVNVGGKDMTFDEFYDLLKDSKGSISAMYSVAKNVLAQLVTPVTDSIRNTVETKINDLQNTWKTNARTNQTSKKEEMEKTFDSENVEDLDELRSKYIAQEQNTANSNEFYDINVDGKTNKDYKYYISEDMTKTYVNKQAPYHVSHILVKVDASEARDGWWDGKISSDDAKQIDNVVSMLTQSDSFGSIAQIASDDEGSAKQYGELYTSGDSAMVAMEKTTSYINEFKLGLYAYEAFLNPKISQSSAQDKVKASLRVPGKAETNEGGHSYENETAVKDTIKEIAIGGKSVLDPTTAKPTNHTSGSYAFGIPISAAFTLGYVADTDKNIVTKNSVDFANESQYPRNILFNKYFNYHGVSFLYDDSDDYDASFLEDANLVWKTRCKQTGTAYTAFTSVDEVKASLPEKYSEYEYVNSKLKKIKDSGGDNKDSGGDDNPRSGDYYKFAEVPNISDHLVSYSEVKNSDGVGIKTGELKKLGKKNILIDKKRDNSISAFKDDSCEPVVVVRGGSSGSYQGIHFIVINNDPFINPDTKYQYYRTNIPKADADKTGPNSNEYKQNPSFINFVKSDLDSNTTYNTRRDTLYKAIKSSDANLDYTLWKVNLDKFKTMYGENYSTVINYKYTENGEEKTRDLMKEIEKYISTAEESSRRSNNESLDNAWETYVQMLKEQETYAPRGILPQVCVSAFEGGSLSEWEDVCHVKK